MSRQKKHLTISLFFVHIVLTIGIGLIFLAMLMYITYLNSKIQPLRETYQNEMKFVPADVKNRIPSPTQTFHVPILLYHYVEYVQDKNDTTRQSLNINPDIFEAQMRTLHDNGYTFMLVRELPAIMDKRRTLPPKPVVITIDDGHWDVVTVILPILQKYNIRATVYVIPGLTGGSDFMTKKQVRTLINSGLIEIGSHTVNHIALQGVFLPTLTYEVEESKKMLEKTYGIHIVSFAYPSGSFDLQAIAAVKKAGYTNAVSTISGTEMSQENRYFINRLHPGQNVGADLLRLMGDESP